MSQTKDEIVVSVKKMKVPGLTPSSFINFLEINNISVSSYATDYRNKRSCYGDACKYLKKKKIVLITDFFFIITGEKMLRISLRRKNLLVKHPGTLCS